MIFVPLVKIARADAFSSVNIDPVEIFSHRFLCFLPAFRFFLHALMQALPTA
jgi:hypothetical protein